MQRVRLGLAKHRRAAAAATIIKNGRSCLVLMSVEDLESIEATLRGTSTKENPMREGTLISTDDKPILRFRRFLPHAVEEVWRAVTVGTKSIGKSYEMAASCASMDVAAMRSVDVCTR
jgi:hypothetical protein